MLNVLAINGSPKKAKGRTAKILKPFLDELENLGANVDLLYSSRLQINPCNCGRFYCWRDAPGKCIHKDAMEHLFPRIKQANLLVFATPIYIPLPGEMQIFLNRLTPLLNPKIRFHDGRTVAQFRDDVQVNNIVLLATGGWWERENLDRLPLIFKEFATVSSVTFGGAILRPHAQRMKKEGQLTDGGLAIMKSIRRAAHELVETGAMKRTTLEEISQPLISREEYFKPRI